MQRASRLVVGDIRGPHVPSSLVVAAGITVGFDWSDSVPESGHSGRDGLELEFDYEKAHLEDYRLLVSGQVRRNSVDQRGTICGRDRRHPFACCHHRFGFDSEVSGALGRHASELNVTAGAGTVRHSTRIRSVDDYRLTATLDA